LRDQHHSTFTKLISQRAANHENIVTATLTAAGVAPLAAWIASAIADGRGVRGTFSTPEIDSRPGKAPPMKLLIPLLEHYRCGEGARACALAARWRIR
jgi:hypothetical protein